MNNKTIGWRLGSLTTLLLICMSVVGVVAIINALILAEKLNYSSDVQLPAVRNMTLVDMMHDGIRANVFHSVIISGSKNEKEIKEVRDESEEFAKKIRENLDSISKLDLGEEIKAAVKESIEPVNEYVTQAHQIVEIALSGKVEKAIEQLDSFQEKFEKLEKSLNVLGDKIESTAQQASKQSAQASSKAKFFSYLFLFIGIFSGLGFAVFIGRDLKNQLGEMIHILSSESNSVSSTASELTNTANELTESATKQASALQETASSLEEITSMVKKTSENSSALEKSAQSSHESASQGEQITTQMLSAIDDISESNTKIMSQIEDGNNKIAEIVKVIGEIGNKTKIINDIVFQTKLLSFNASVEAARAGEHGKGFAVVAEEVGNLAQMSGNAAKEISDMLDSSIRTVNTIVSENKEKVEKLISDGRTKLEAGKEVSARCKQSLEEIVNQSTEVTRLISEITIAIQEQNQGIQEISKALNLLDQSAHKTSSMSEKTSNTSSKLLVGSEQLQEIVLSLEGLAIGTKTGAEQQSPKRTMSPQQNVIQLKTLSHSKKVQNFSSSDHVFKKAVGDSSALPDKNDPRFEDV